MSLYSLYHVCNSGISSWPIRGTSRVAARDCRITRQERESFERMWESYESGPDTGLSYELSLGGGQVELWIRHGQGSKDLGYIPISTDVARRALHSLSGHDGWKFMVAASALFHTVSRLFRVDEGRIEHASVITRSLRYLTCYGSPFDGMDNEPFASAIHEVDWIFGSVCNARSLAFQCLVTRQVHVQTPDLPVFIHASLLGDIKSPPLPMSRASSLEGRPVLITLTGAV